MIQIEDNDSPITVAQKLIYGTKPVTWTMASKLGYIIATGEAPKEEKHEADKVSEGTSCCRCCSGGTCILARHRKWAGMLCL